MHVVQSELDATMRTAGLLPIVAPVPHYGNPSDLPARPPTFSGIQYRLPSAAVSELPPFWSGDGTTAGPLETLRARTHSLPQPVGSSTRHSDGWVASLDIIFHVVVCEATHSFWADE